MAAYIVFIRDKLRDQKEMDTYAAKVRPTLGAHSMKSLSFYGRHETLEGAPIDGAVILEFPTYDAALAFYHSPAYQGALKHRHLAADYRVFITEGL